VRRVPGPTDEPDEGPSDAERPEDGPAEQVRALEDLAPSAELGPITLAVTGPPRRRVDAARAVLPGLVLVAVCVAAAYGVSRVIPSISPLVAAVALGALLANVGLVPEWSRAGAHFAAKRLLRFGVVLLGFQLAVREVLALGGPGLVVVAVVVTTTFFGTQWLGRRLGVSAPLSLLIATGFSICGASAVAAVEGVADADEEEVAFAIGLVTLCGSMAIAILPALAGPLGVHGSRFGAWTGASVHDVAQVVATASTGGSAALRTAVIVKLTRVVLLAPLVAGVTVARRRRAVAVDTVDDARVIPDEAPAKPPILPLFVVGFLVAIALRSASLVPSGWLPTLKVAETLTLAAALVGLGTGVRIARLRRLGGRPLLLALLSWLLIAVVSYVGVILVGA
jgi:uncharacterized integral membrane protein (TIGR00698 family)